MELGVRHARRMQVAQQLHVALGQRDLLIVYLVVDAPLGERVVLRLEEGVNAVAVVLLGDLGPRHVIPDVVVVLVPLHRHVTNRVARRLVI